MADLSITTGNLQIASSRSRPQTVQAGSSIAIGKLVYLDSTSGKYELANADAAATATVAGIAVTGASADGYFSMLQTTSLVLGATIVAGTPYYLSSANAGGIAPFADLGSGDTVTLLGFASTTSVLDLNIQSTGIAI